MLPDHLTLWLMAGVGALLAGAAIQLVLAVSGRRTRSEEVARQQAERTLRKDMLALTQENLGLSARVARVEAEMTRTRAERGAAAPAEMPRRPAALPHAASPTPTESVYAVAARLSRRGATVDEIIETCCLTRGEVELLHKLYARQPAPDGIPVVSRTASSEA